MTIGVFQSERRKILVHQGYQYQRKKEKELMQFVRDVVFANVGYHVGQTCSK